jgi:Ca2+-binding EF-hand superfamily protein
MAAINPNDRRAALRRGDLSDSVPAFSPKQLLRKRYEDQQLSKLTTLNLTALDGVFNDIRSSEGATLDKARFREAMLRADIKLFEEESVCDSFYNAIDKNHDGAVDKKELIIGLTAFAQGSVEKKLELGFSVFDLNGDGYISKAEMSTMLALAAKVSLDCSDELDELITDFVGSTFEQFDENKDEKLSIDEFKKAALTNDAIRSFFTLESAFERGHSPADAIIKQRSPRPHHQDDSN